MSPRPATARRVRRLFLAVAGLSMLALLLRLGFWQLDRAAYKDALTQTFAANRSAPAMPAARLLEAEPAGAWTFRQATADGAWQTDRQYLLDNRTYNGRAGYHVLTPVIATSSAMLVNRGWVPLEGGGRERLPEVGIDTAGARVLGRLVPPPVTGLLLGESGHGKPGWPKVVQSVDLDRMSAALGQPLLPAVLLLDAGHPACFVCDWRPVAGVDADRHRGYAVQWFALAATLVVISAVLLLRGRRDAR